MLLKTLLVLNILVCSFARILPTSKNDKNSPEKEDQTGVKLPNWILDLLTNEHPLKNKTLPGHVEAVEVDTDMLEEDVEDLRHARVLERKVRQRLTNRGPLLEYDVLLQLSGDGDLKNKVSAGNKEAQVNGAPQVLDKHDDTSENEIKVNELPKETIAEGMKPAEPATEIKEASPEKAPEVAAEPEAPKEEIKIEPAAPEPTQENAEKVVEESKDGAAQPKPDAPEPVPVAAPAESNPEPAAPVPLPEPAAAEPIPELVAIELVPEPAPVAEEQKKEEAKEPAPEAVVEEKKEEAQEPVPEAVVEEKKEEAKEPVPEAVVEEKKEEAKEPVPEAAVEEKKEAADEIKKEEEIKQQILAVVEEEKKKEEEVKAPAAENSGAVKEESATEDKNMEEVKPAEGENQEKPAEGENKEKPAEGAIKEQPAAVTEKPTNKPTTFWGSIVNLEKTVERFIASIQNLFVRPASTTSAPTTAAAKEETKAPAEGQQDTAASEAPKAE